MKNILISLIVLVAVVGCKDSSNGNSGTQAQVPNPTVPVDVSNQHNSSECPTNLLGVYRLEDSFHKGFSNEILKISLQNNGVLTTIKQVDGVELTALAEIVDGSRRLIPSQNSTDYQISYCENQAIVTVGFLLGQNFKETIYGTRFGLRISYETSGREPANLIYRRF